MVSISNFTPLTGMLGGSIIGFGSTVLLLTNGDIMGASGIVTPIFIQAKDTWDTQRWKYVFVASFIGAANGYLVLVDPRAIHDEALTWSPSLIGYILAGLLVGFGTRLGNGCTSGHGICGLARLSRRSFAAVGTFMATAMATASLLPQGFLKSMTQPSSNVPSGSFQWVGIVIAAVALVAVISVSYLETPAQQSGKMIGASVSGALFAIGLVVSGMVLPSKVMGFLNLSTLASSSGTYDPTLAFVMLGGLLVSYAGYQYKSHVQKEKPILAEEYNVPCNTVIDGRLLLGASCFGLGWGLVGLCPGPALFLASTGNMPVLYSWMPSFLVGSYLGGKSQYLFPGKLCQLPLLKDDVTLPDSDKEKGNEDANKAKIIFDESVTSSTKEEGFAGNECNTIAA